MHFCAIGKAVDVTLEGLIVEENGERLTLELDGDELKEIQLGKSYCFAGSSRGGKMHAERVVLRRFLDPLYEQDVLEASGEYAIVKPIKDPFPEAFKRLAQRDEAQASEFPTRLEIEPAEPAEDQKSATRLPCSVCGKPQFKTPSGLACEEGHGGAESIEGFEAALAEQESMREEG